MEDAEAQALVERAVELGSWQPPAGCSVAFVRASEIQRLWGGMGSVLELDIATTGGTNSSHQQLVAKHVQLPAGQLDVGDQRKKDSYVCEAHFFGGTMAAELRQAGCCVPRGILVDRRDDGVTILMSRLTGSSGGRMQQPETSTAVVFLATMHGHTWGARADAAVAAGAQPQGCYWYLDTRLDEMDSISQRGWTGRLRRAARALDERLKADPSGGGGAMSAMPRKKERKK